MPMTSHRTLLAASLILSACLSPAPSRADDPPVPAPVKPHEPPKQTPATQVPDEKAAAEAASDKQRLERHALIERLFGPEIWDVKDGADIQEEPQWRNAVEVMANLDPKYIEENGSFALNGHFDVLMKDPSAFRGRFVR